LFLFGHLEERLGILNVPIQLFPLFYDRIEGGLLFKNRSGLFRVRPEIFPA